MGLGFRGFRGSGFRVWAIRGLGLRAEFMKFKGSGL